MDLLLPYAGHGERLLCSSSADSMNHIRDLLSWPNPAYDTLATGQLLNDLRCQGFSHHFLVTDGVLMGNLSGQSWDGEGSARGEEHWSALDYLGEAHRVRSGWSRACEDRLVGVSVVGDLVNATSMTASHDLVCGGDRWRELEGWTASGVKEGLQYKDKMRVFSDAFNKSLSPSAGGNRLRPPPTHKKRPSKHRRQTIPLPIDTHLGIRLTPSSSVIPANTSTLTCTTIDDSTPLVTCDARMMAIDLSRVLEWTESHAPPGGLLNFTCGLDEGRWFQGLVGGKGGPRVEVGKVGVLGWSLEGGVGWGRRASEFLEQDQEIRCDAWIDETLYFVKSLFRWDTTNPYQAHQDFLNAFTSYASVRPPLFPNTTHPILLDTHPDGPYIKAWSHIFSHTKMLYTLHDLADRIQTLTGKIDATVCIKRGVWGAHGGVSPLSLQGSFVSKCFLNPLLSGFRAFLVDGWRRVNGVSGQRGVLVSGVYDPEVGDMRLDGSWRPVVECGGTVKKSRKKLTVGTLIWRWMSKRWDVDHPQRILSLFLPVDSLGLLQKVSKGPLKGHLVGVENWVGVGHRLDGQTNTPQNTTSHHPSLWKLLDLIHSTSTHPRKAHRILKLPIMITYAIRKSATLNSTARLTRVVSNEGEFLKMLERKVGRWNEALEEGWEGVERASVELFPSPQLHRRGGGGSDFRSFSNPPRPHQDNTLPAVDGGKCTLPPPSLRRLWPRIEFRAVDFAVLEMDQQVAVAQGTDVMVGPHGASFVHEIFLRRAPVAGVLELQPRKRSVGNLQFRNLAMGMGHLYMRLPIMDSYIPNMEDVADGVLRMAAAVSRERMRFAMRAAETTTGNAT
ncbi:hypothetical protein HDU67_002347 [Dinochytrium kinnereticum]|nr:hypothetical protein HDU67_002347 [Dinochytrium kinnereticum]